MNAPQRSPLSLLLSELKERSDLSMEKIAKRAGYKGRSSVQRFFDTDDLLDISHSVAQRLANAFYGLGDPPISVSDLAPLVGVSVHSQSSMPLEFVAELLDLKINQDFEWREEISSSRPSGIPVVGSAYASSWMESTHTIDAPSSWLLSHNAGVGEYKDDYALKIIGPSVNKVAKEGSFAICRQYGLAARVAEDGKFVHVERERDGLREWTIKRVRWHGNQPMLFPESDHPDHQKPLPFDEAGGVVSILGVVTGWYTPA